MIGSVLHRRLRLSAPRVSASRTHQKSGTLRRAFTALAVLVTVLCGTSAKAQQPATDRVTLQPENSSSHITVPCDVLDYTADSIQIRLRTGGSVRTYPASEVADVETPQTEPHIRGLARFAQGRTAEASDAFQQALTVETRAWVRREILAMLVRCALMQGDTASAGDRFLAMLERHPQARHFHLIPLSWAPPEGDGSEPVESNLRNTARAWLLQPSEAARLLGASFLLGDADSSATAKSQLDKLAASPDRRIRQLAQAQLWRLRLTAPHLSRNELVHWEDRIESMPGSLRGGPYYVLGCAYLDRKEYDRAAAAFLWLPLVYDHDPNLAARACLQAAGALKRIGQDSEALTLYGEVVHRFRETSSAEQAASILQSSPQRPDTDP